MKKLKVALVGNPNSGKTTLFNALTGARQRVGNWPGVTVEHKIGKFKSEDYDVEVIDLPGIYSFSAFTMDEKVARDYIINEKPDVVVNIVDSSNLERNLYLTTQLLEMKIPVVVALNMVDICKKKNIHVEDQHLALHLDCPVIPIVASKRKGIEKLRSVLLKVAEEQKIPDRKVYYDPYLEDRLSELYPLLTKYAQKKGMPERWLGIKLLEKEELAEAITNNDLDERVNEIIKKVEHHTGDDIDIVVADGRYGFIHGLTKDVLHKEAELRKSVSDTIDKLALNKLLGIPLFFGVMYLVFLLTIKVGEPFIEFFDIFFGAIFVDAVENLLLSISSPEWLIQLLAYGIGGGIQTVSTFIPPIFLMFLALSFLEDSGYMARAAFVMDKFMRYIGLPGKAFIPMLIGFGCNVPAIMATRTLEKKRDRYFSIAINPLMSCGARIPVYVLFGVVFFADKAGFVIFSMYLTGILLAVLMGLLFQKTIFSEQATAFVMELPPYHVPTFNGILLHTWQRLQGFIIRAGKVILLFVIVLSFLNSITIEGHFDSDDVENSVLSYIGKIITPVFRPMGITQDNWPATVGLFTGIFAKESIVGTLDTLYSRINKSENQDKETEEETTVADKIREAFAVIGDKFKDEDESKETNKKEEGTRELDLGEKSVSLMEKKFGNWKGAYSYLLFVLIYAPCLAVIGTIYRETTLKWTIFTVTYLTVLAWIVATFFYNLFNILNNPSNSIFWIAFSGALFGIFYYFLKFKGKWLME